MEKLVVVRYGNNEEVSPSMSRWQIKKLADQLKMLFPDNSPVILSSPLPRAVDCQKKTLTKITR